jgi:hypothetical protein
LFSMRSRYQSAFKRVFPASMQLRVKAKKDLKEFGSRLTNIRAVFVYSPRLYQDVAWTIQLAGSGTMSPRPAVFCGSPYEDPDADPGLTLRSGRRKATIWLTKMSVQLIEPEGSG